jgi:hypothetical protein
LARMTFSGKGGRVKAKTVKEKPKSAKTAEEVVRDIKKGLQKPPGEDYRERSLAIHGLICARCAREFDDSTRHLLTVHHKDGNHRNNPPDGSNWENLCVYCHDDAHSRGLLGDYLGGAPPERGGVVVHGEDRSEGPPSGPGALGAKLLEALKKKEKKY